MLAVDTMHKFSFPSPRAGALISPFSDLYQYNRTPYFRPESPPITFRQSTPVDIPQLPYPLLGFLRHHHINPILPNCRPQMPRAPHIEPRTQRDSPANPTTMATEAASMARLAPVTSASWESTKIPSSPTEDHHTSSIRGFIRPRRQRQHDIREPAHSPPLLQPKTVSIRVIHPSKPDYNGTSEPNVHREEQDIESGGSSHHLKRTSEESVYTSSPTVVSDRLTQSRGGNTGYHSYPVDPTYSLHLAVECHRATQQDTDGDTPLHIAISQADEIDASLIRHLISLVSLSGRSIDIFNFIQQTPLHIAVITDHPGITHLLLDAGANPNEPDRNGQTAVHHACLNNSIMCLKTILEKSKFTVDLNSRNYNGFAPLHNTIMDNNMVLTNALITAGASVEVQDAKNGWTPLFHAVINQNNGMITRLLEIGAFVNAQSYSGNTPLHVATGRGYIDVVRLLMSCGADMSVKNTHRDTAVMVSSSNMISNILRGSGSPAPVPIQLPSVPQPKQQIRVPTRRRAIPTPHPLSESVHIPSRPLGRKFYSDPLSLVTHGRQAEKEMRHISRTPPLSKPEQYCNSQEEIVIVDEQAGEETNKRKTPASSSCRVSVIVQPPAKKRRRVMENNHKEKTIYEKMPLVSRMLQKDGLMDRAATPEFVVKELPSMGTTSNQESSSRPSSRSGTQGDEEDMRSSPRPSSPPMDLELEGELEIQAPSPESVSESDEPDTQMDSSCSAESSTEPKEGVLHIVEDTDSQSQRQESNTEIDSPRGKDGSSSVEVLSVDSSSRSSTPKHRHDENNDDGKSDGQSVGDKVLPLKRLREDNDDGESDEVLPSKRLREDNENVDIKETENNEL